MDVDRNPQDLAGRQVRGRPAGDAHASGAALREQAGDLRAGRARPDDEHVAVAVGLGVSVGAGMDQLAAEAVAPRPVGDVGVVVETGRDDHEARLQVLAIGLDPPAPVHGLQPPDPRAEANVDAMVSGIVLEVGDPRVPRRELAVAPAAGAIAGLRGHPARRIEPQPVVAGPPARGDLVGPLEHGHIDVDGPKRGRRRKPGGARAADDRLRHQPGAPDPEVMCSITGKNSSVGEKSTYSESSSASGAWPADQ